MSTDPLAKKYAAWSPYAYVLDNPVMLVDPDGRAAQSPIFDENGNFLGTDSGGFKGDIVIMSKDLFSALTKIHDGTLPNSLVMEMAEGEGPHVQTLDDYVANDFDITSKEDNKFLGGVFTNLLSAAKDEGLISYDVSNLAFGTIGIDNDTESPTDDAARYYDAGGRKDAISVLMKPGKDGSNFSMLYVGDAANAIHILGVHEPLHRKFAKPGDAGHGPMYKAIYDNPEYRKSLKDVTTKVKELAETWRKKGG